ncbi:hypothetical protein JW899_03555 [Candidatus Uhrbacteria bacterium]|nr:hypothetical protein [Candidatus Uhrbacteria bacterium]
MAATSMKFRLSVRLAAVAGLVSVMLFLVVRNLVPGGEMTVTTDLLVPVPFVSEPKPGERLEAASGAGSGGGVTMRSGPIYLDLKPPGGFDTVTMVVRYRNESGRALELGGMTSASLRQFDVRPAENGLLDGLAWERVSSGNLTLWQREGHHISLDDFYANPPERSRLAVLGTTASGIPYRHPGYGPLGGRWEATVSLRGQHRLLTYVRGETLDITFTVQDMNRSSGPDPVAVTVCAEGGSEPLARTVLGDDGNVGDDQRSSPLRTVSVSAAGLPEGPYVIGFDATDDVFIRHLKSSQGLLSFAGRVYLGDFIGYSDDVTPVTVWSDGRRFRVETPHDDGRQVLTVDGRQLDVSEPLVSHAVSVSPSGHIPFPIVSPKRNVIIETDGTISLTAGSWFNPLPFQVSRSVTESELDERGIDYVLAGYRTPDSDGGVKVATAEFQADTLDRTPDGSWRFAVMSQDLGESDGQIRLDSVSFVLRRTGGIRGLRNGWQALLKGFGEEEASDPAVSCLQRRNLGEFPE